MSNKFVYVSGRFQYISVVPRLAEKNFVRVIGGIGVRLYWLLLARCQPIGHLNLTMST